MKRSETAVKYAHRYLTSRQLPDSAIDLLDEAAATVQNRDSNGRKGRVDRLGSGFDGWQVEESSPALRSRGRSRCLQKEVTDQDVLVTLSQLSGIPTQKLDSNRCQEVPQLRNRIAQARDWSRPSRFEYQSGLFDAINQVSVATSVRLVLSCS